MLNKGVFVNIYMFFGGTNFGFTAGNKLNLKMKEKKYVNVLYNYFQVQMIGESVITWPI